MTRSLTSGLFVLAALAQLAFPAALIARYESTLRLGAAYRMKTAPVDPVDVFRGRYVTLSFDVPPAPWRGSGPPASGSEVYALLDVGPDGFGRVREVAADKPARGDWLTVKASPEYRYEAGETRFTGNVSVTLPFDRFYMDETKAADAERRYREANRAADPSAGAPVESWALVRVRGGAGVLEDLVIGGTSARSPQPR